MRPAYPLLVLAAAAAACSQASAIGLGPVRSSAVLGQPLDLPVPMRLDDGETVTQECVTAEVTAGEQKLQPGEVRIVIENGPSAGERIVRVRSSAPMLEPIVTVAVSAGCPLQLLRRFTVFADPPPLVMAPAVLAQTLPTTPPVATPAAPAAAAAPVRSSEATVSSAQPVEPQRSEVRRPRPSRPGADSANAEATRSTASRAVARAASAPQAPRPRARSATAPRPAASASAQPRLRLDLDTRVARAGEAVRPPSTTASAALAAPSVAPATAPPSANPGPAAAASAAVIAAASAAAADPPGVAPDSRMVAMEAELAKLRAEAKANRDALLQLRARVDDPPRDDLLIPGLAAVAALLALLTAWLAWRLRKLSRERQPWWDSRAPVSPATVEIAPPSSAEVQPVPSVPAPPPIAVAASSRRPDHVDTMPLAIPPLPPVPEMSVDEQIDLEQQADFFLVLGQEDSAIELLHANLRATQGASPVPYLKLLDIHRRSGDREAYDALRERFNQRFNGIVPAIQVDARAGRSLEAYPDVLERLQAQWSRPVDALATLEALLFKRGEGQGRFEMPAYRELMALHQLARELAQGDGGSHATEVDLLLPLGEDDAPALQAVHPSAFERTAVLDPGSVPPRPPRAAS